MTKIKNKDNIRKFSKIKNVNVRSSDNTNKQKDYIARYMDFLMKLGQAKYIKYIEGINKSKELTKKEKEDDLRDLDLYSFTSGVAILGEMFLTLTQTNFNENVKVQLLKAMEPYNNPTERYKVLVDYFLQHGKNELKKSPIEKDIDTESFLTGFVFLGTELFAGLVFFKLKQTDDVYREFINLANKKINLK